MEIVITAPGMADVVLYPVMKRGDAGTRPHLPVSEYYSEAGCLFGNSHFSALSCIPIVFCALPASAPCKLLEAFQLHHRLERGKGIDIDAGDPFAQFLQFRIGRG